MRSRLFTLHAPLLAIVSTLIGCASDAPLKNEADSLESRINKMVVEAEKKNFSGNVLVMKNGEKLFSRSYGYASVELAVPNNEQTVFLLGSCSKQFTAMCLLMLEEEGKLKVSDPALKHFPGLPTEWKDVRIEHMIAMTSGIPDFVEFKNFDKKLPMTEKRMCALMKGRPLEFKPGEKFRYSNTNYVLLTYLVGKLSGMPYEKFLMERIIEKHGLSSTGYYEQGKIVRNRADGYAPSRGGGLKRAAYIDMSNPTGAGALYSTVGDMAKWDAILRTAPPVSKKSMEKLVATSDKKPYSYGWVASRTAFGNRLLLGHEGQIDGFHSCIFRFPEEGVVIVALSNFEEAPVGPLCAQIAMELFGIKKPSDDKK